MTLFKLISEKINLLNDLHTKKPVVVTYGIMNAGKSSLLNMLTKNIDQEFFKTNDVRETSEIKKFESEKYIYLDTPGLDANNADDLQAQIGVAQADIVLFLHQPQGALEANEANFLKNLKKSFGNHAESNIILVITKIEKENPAKIDLIENEIKKQCVVEVGFTPKIFQISNNRYKTGIINQKDGLVAQSHIHSLIKHIDTIASNAKKVRIERYLNDIESLLEDIKNKEQKILSRKKQINDDFNQVFSSLNIQTNSLKSFLTDSSRKYREI